MKIQERLQALRQLMKERKISAYIVPTDDFHGSEYVGEYFKAREYLSGFTGSAGTLVVLPESAYLWTDGRYYLQAAQQLVGSGITLMKAGEPDVPDIPTYLFDHLEPESCIGFDGRTVTGSFVKNLEEKTKEKKMHFSWKEDLAGRIWKDRPEMSKEPIWELDSAYAGLTREEKLHMVRREMDQKKCDVLMIPALDEIAWLLNLRGNDIPYTPVFLSYLVIKKDSAILCLQESSLSEAIRQKLCKAGVSLAPYDEIQNILSQISKDKTVMADPQTTNYALLNSIPEGVHILKAPSPIVGMKAVKTEAEMDHIRAAHMKDGIAVTKFIYWLKSRIDKEEITELSAAHKIEELRRQQEDFVEPSFASIIAYDAHGAVIHYAPTEQSNVPMRPRGFCLADTGGHYLQGTTDITRTISLKALTEEEKCIYTLVLKGNLRLASAKFPHGASGANLDSIARGPLWEHGLDYNHGTGHGVGYLLGVHEAPQRFQWKPGAHPAAVLEEGMVISDEPGMYIAGKFGVRLENLLLCRKGEKSEYGQFMYFENLTWVPFDRDAIDVSLLTKEECDLLDLYHRTVYEKIGPYLTDEERKWLTGETASIQ